MRQLITFLVLIMLLPGLSLVTGCKRPNNSNTDRYHLDALKDAKLFTVDQNQGEFLFIFEDRSQLRFFSSERSVRTDQEGELNNLPVEEYLELFYGRKVLRIDVGHTNASIVFEDGSALKFKCRRKIRFTTRLSVKRASILEQLLPKKEEVPNGN